MRHTVVYTVLFVPITLVLSLLVAAALNRRVRGISIYRLAVFIPVVTSTVATGVIFTWLLDPNYGIVNAVLAKVGLPTPGWFSSPDTAMYAVILMTVWAGRVRHADLPRRSPGDPPGPDGGGADRRVHESRGLLADPGAAAATGLRVPPGVADDQRPPALRRDLRDHQGRTAALHDGHRLLPYQQAFVYFHAGYAAAIAVVLFVVIVVVTVVQMRVSRDPDLEAGMSATVGERTLASRLRVRRPSAWHLVLLPLSVLMAVPLLWMLVTSLSTLEETRRFHPACPARCTGRTTSTRGRAPAGALAAQQHDRLGDVRHQQPRPVQPRGLRVRTHPLPGQPAAVPAAPGDADGAVPGGDDPDAADRQAPGHRRLAAGTDRAQPGDAVRHYPLRQFFLSLPAELEEAALIDGAGRVRILTRILLPLMGPPLATLAVLTFLTTWNDFLWPLVVTSSPETMTVQLGPSTFQSAHFTKWPILMAATLLSQLPVFALFLVGQRWFVSSIATTGIK